MRYYHFQPLYQERVWGGRALQDRLGRTLPAGGPIGESWEIVDRPEAQSVVSDGPESGRTLRALIEAKAEQIMGPGWAPERRFPILVKWLDCRERLSLQVHPPASVAAGLGGEPKTENWYVAHAAPGAAVLAGLVPGVDVARFRSALATGTAEALLIRHATRAGDSLFIPSGVMHAIDAGNLILEIQQNSDTTYRVYDWGRVGLDGRPRQMHVEQSLACLAANRAAPPRVCRGEESGGLLADSAEFRLRRVPLAAGARLEFAAGEQPRILSVVEGSLREADGRVIPYGASLLLPHAESFAFAAAGNATVLVTDHFHQPTP